MSLLACDVGHAVGTVEVGREANRQPEPDCPGAEPGGRLLGMADDLCGETAKIPEKLGAGRGANGIRGHLAKEEALW
jgi:hypothetical protein